MINAVSVKRQEAHTHTIGANPIWKIGECLEPQDARSFLLWTSGDIRRLSISVLPNWIDSDLRSLGYQGPKPAFADRVFCDLTLEEAETEIIRAISRIKTLANSEPVIAHLELFFKDPYFREKFRDILTTKDSGKRDDLLCKFVSDPKIPTARALEVSQLLSDDTDFRKNSAKPLPGLAAFLSLGILFSRIAFDRGLEKFAENSGSTMWQRVKIIGVSFFLVFNPFVCLSLTPSTMQLVTQKYKGVTSGKHPIHRVEWQRTRAMFAAFGLGSYVFFRRTNHDPYSVFFGLATLYLDSMFLMSAIAETRLFLGI